MKPGPALRERQLLLQDHQLVMELYNAGREQRDQLTRDD
jgi:hypothetical protein